VGKVKSLAGKGMRLYVGYRLNGCDSDMIWFTKRDFLRREWNSVSLFVEEFLQHSNKEWKGSMRHEAKQRCEAVPFANAVQRLSLCSLQ